MPIDTIAVGRVDAVTVRAQAFGTWRTKYIVCVERDPDQHGWTPVYDTFSELVASLCLGAKQTSQRVVVGWKDTQYGREIVTCELEQKEGAA